MKNVLVCLMVVLLAGCSSRSRDANAPATSSPQTGAASTSPQAAQAQDTSAQTATSSAGSPAAQAAGTGLAAPSQPLSTFSDFELKPMTLADAVAKNRGKRTVAGQLESRLRERVQSLLDEWKADKSSTRTGGTLVIQPQLQDLRIISGGARFWGGSMAGGSYITMTLQLIDGKTGTIIASPIISRSSNAVAGTWTMGAMDRNLLNWAVEIARQYLVENYKKQ
jgi:uncharacterized protein YceK